MTLTREDVDDYIAQLADDRDRRLHRVQVAADKVANKARQEQAFVMRNSKPTRDAYDKMSKAGQLVVRTVYGDIT